MCTYIHLHTRTHTHTQTCIGLTAFIFRTLSLVLSFSLSLSPFRPLSLSVFNFMKVEVPAPDRHARVNILRAILKVAPIRGAEDLDVGVLEHELEGFSSHDLHTLAGICVCLYMYTKNAHKCMGN